MTSRLAFLLLLTAVLSLGCSSGEQHAQQYTTLVDHDEARNRQLEILFWQPKTTIQQAMPLVIFAHGLGGQPEQGAWLADYLISKGYVVAAVKFPHTNGDDVDAMDMNDLLNQPGDVSRVIDIALGKAPGLPASLQGKIDDQRIALAGHSFGGLTTYLATYDRELMEPRIQAAILLAAGAGDIFYPEFYSTRPIPMLLLHGDHDKLVDFNTTSAVSYQRAETPKILARLIGGTHLGHGEMNSVGFNLDNLPCWLAKESLEDDGNIHFHADLVKREPATGVGDYSAPMPCEYEVPGIWSMSTERQQQLSNDLILPFLEYALNPANTQNKAAFISTAKQLNQENKDLDIQLSL